MESLPGQLMQMEADRDALIEAMSAPDYYSSHSPQEIKEQTEAIEKLNIEINAGYERWDELENKKALAEQP